MIVPDKGSDHCPAVRSVCISNVMMPANKPSTHAAKRSRQPFGYLIHRTTFSRDFRIKISTPAHIDSFPSIWSGVDKYDLSPVTSYDSACCIPSISTCATSGRENCGGGLIPSRSISRTLVPERWTCSDLSCGQVLLEAMLPHLLQ